MIGRSFTFTDSLKRMHLVRIDRASSTDPAQSPECTATIVESLDARAVGTTVHLLYSDLRPRVFFDVARKEMERGTVALRQANDIVRALQADEDRTTKEPRKWR